ncbi:MAG: peptidylprolyl isomerase [Planctomycetes bacterium]|nr:peptidylprolyl isomerase [Planctomycetota bacterium]
MAQKKSSVGSFVFGLLIAALIGVGLGLLIVNPGYKAPANFAPPEKDKGDAPAPSSYDDNYGKLATPVASAKVTHILVKVGATSKPAGKKRTEAEAKKLVEDIWKQYADAPEKDKDKVWKDLQVKYNEDNGDHNEYDVTPNAQLVQGFKDIGLTTEVKKARIAPYDKVKSHYGFHLIRREK